MVVTKQMQAAVDHQMRPVGLECLALLGGFTLDHGHADHQVAQQRDVEKLVRHICRKRQDVGGVILLPPSVIQLATFGLVDQANGHLGVGGALAQGQLAPLAELGFARGRRLGRDLQIKLKHRVGYPWRQHHRPPWFRSARRLRQSVAPMDGAQRLWAGSA
ncbi:hypothetical protein D3C76_1103540 [compost metagenome]